MNTQHVVIVAGGSGSRMKSLVPKQFILLAGKPILMWTTEVFYNYNPAMKIYVVLPREQIPFWKELCQKHEFSIDHEIIVGGETRFHSVRKGLSAIPDDGVVAIHDGVRPLVSRETIARCFEKGSCFGNAIPCIPVYESVRNVHGDSSTIVDRENLRLIQTPQVFSCILIKEAYKQKADPDFTDDASVLERMGYTIHLVEGNRENIKITNPFDLSYAEYFLTHQ